MQQKYGAVIRLEYRLTVIYLYTDIINDMDTTINTQIKAKFASLGFKKKRYDFFRPINDNVSATIGYTSATHGTKGHTLVNPVIGIAYEDVNLLYDQLCGYKHNATPTLWMPIGYLMPEGDYKEWNFIDGVDNADVLNDMLSAIKKYGGLYWDKMCEFGSLFDAVYDRTTGLMNDRRNRLLPILYYMRGEKEKGQQAIDSAIKEMLRVKPNQEILNGVPTDMQDNTQIIRVGVDTASKEDVDQMFKNMKPESAIVFAGPTYSGFVDPEYIKFAEQYKALP